MKTFALAAITGLLCATSAQADVVYNWQQIAATPPLQTTVGRLVLTDAAFASGTVNADYFGSQPLYPADSAVQEFVFDAPGQPAGRILIAPARADAPRIFGSMFRLTIGADGALSGTIHARSTDAIVEMSGATSLWRIDNYGTEGGPCAGGGCRGTTGRWVLDQSTVPGGGGTGQVPLPGTLPLMALSAFGIAAGLRKPILVLFGRASIRLS